jgi:hypothetical protein
LIIISGVMAEITLEQLRKFSSASTTMVTVDAPLFGVVLILNGRLVFRGPHEAEKIGSALGFPPRDQVLAEASRFWIQEENGIRRCKTRDEMAQLLRETKRAAGVR